MRSSRAWCFGALLWSPWTFAQSPSYELHYEADANCPDAVTFSQLVENQLLQFESPATRLTGFRARVQLRALTKGAWARFELERPDGTRYERELRERSCEELAPALAFVLAYALGGHDSSGPPPTAPPEVTVPTANAEAAPALPASQAPGGATAAARASPPRSEPEPPWQVGLGVELGARSGVAPSWTLVEGVGVELRQSSSSFPSFHVRATLLRGEPGTLRLAVGETRFSWLAGRLDVCPLQLSVATTLSLLPCLGSHVGRLEVVGRPSGQPEATGRTARNLWLDAVASLRVELLLWGVLSLQARGELLSALTPYHFAFDNPDTHVYLTPRVASAAYIGLGGRFP